MKKQGVISIYLALTLTILLSLITGVIEAARVNTIRFQIECAMDASMYSIFAEYNREVLEQYDLFLIDSTYGKNRGGNRFVEKQLLSYLEYNLEMDKGLTIPSYKDFFGLTPTSIATQSVSLATDEEFAVIKEQAIRYMKDVISMGMIEEIESQLAETQNNGLWEDSTQERERLQETIDSYKGKELQDQEGNSIVVEVENPADAVNKERGGGYLYLVTQGGEGISGRSKNLDLYASHRNLNSGDGMAPGVKKAEGMADELLFGEYIVRKCSSYTKVLEKADLSYQVEYILMGEESDLDNLKGVTNRLLILRETANYLYLQTDAGRRGEAEALALTISTVALVPEIKDVLTQIILFAWAYAESVNDIKILLENGKVPLMKTSSDWKMGLTEMVTYKNHLSAGGEGINGQTYEAYLRMLLAIMPKEEKVKRLADIIEMDIRKAGKSKFFCLDYCMSSMEIEVEVSSTYGYSYTIKRRTGYERM